MPGVSRELALDEKTPFVMTPFSGPEVGRTPRLRQPLTLEVGEILLFLLPAMGVVESIDHFNGFDLITKAVCKEAAAGVAIKWELRWAETRVLKTDTLAC